MKSENSQNPLGYAPISGLIAKYAIPSVISMLVSAAYNITGQIFIGNVVGVLGNAATNVAFPVILLCTAIAQLAGIGVVIHKVC
jgi:Na+-driven multidrug efflux pump